MNTKTSAFSKAMTIVTCLLTVFATVVRALLMSNYNGVSGFYTNELLANVLNFPLIAFAVVTFAAAHIYIKEGNLQISMPESKATRVVSLICACVFGGLIIYNFAKLVLPTLESPNAAALFMSLFAVVALLYFLSGNSKLGDMRALLALGSALTLLALVFGLYFNTKISYVNHSAVLCYAACIFLMLATVAEANSILKRPFLCRYLSYAPTAAVLAISLSVTDIIYAVANANAPLTDIYYDFIILAMGVYHLVKLISLSLIKPEKEEK